MLSDRDQIANLLARYCFFIDDGDVERWRQLFTPGAVMRIGETVFDGRDAFTEALVGWGAFGVGRHVNLNCVIEVGDDGTASTVIDFLFAWKDAAGNPSLTTTPGPHFGRYHDRLVRVDGEWKLSERAIAVFGAGEPAAVVDREGSAPS
jgi:hypothetical protein